MKKFLATVLAVLLLVSALPMGMFTLTASAETSGYYDYTVLNGEATITHCDTAISGNVTIPSTLDGYPVTSIGSSAFYGCNGLTSITIPDSVTSIGEDAFSRCTGLTSVTISDSVKSIGSSAFFYCSSLTSVTIPDSVKSIGSYAFDGCTSLKSVYINDISSWCEISFAGYASNPLYYAGNLYLNSNLLTDLTIPDSVTSIGDYAFDGCSSLTSITIPDSVKSIGSYAFDGCTSLKSVYINDISSWCEISFSDSYANPLRYARNLYLNSNLLTDLTIPNSVTSIGRYAFYNCTSLTSVTIPDSVTSIGSVTFYNCTGLTSVTILGGVTSIGYNAFYGCSKIEKMTLPFIGATLNGTANNHFGYIFGASGYSENQKFVPASLKTVVITGGNLIDKYAFYECSKIEEVIITANVREIGYRAFEYCTELKSIYIPKCVTNFKGGTFDKCNQLTIYCTKNSKAHDFAQLWDIPFKTVGSYKDKFGVIYGVTPGDLNGDEAVTDADAVYLLYYTFLPDTYPVNQDCDFNGDGEITDRDAIYLLYHTFLPDVYPIS